MAFLAASDINNPWVMLRSWTWDPLVVAGVGLGLWWYLRAVARLRPARWPGWRSRCFVAGNVVLILALLSPVDVYAELLLSVHMVQHLLLTMVAPPLLLLGAPLTLAIRTVRPSDREILLRFLHGRVVGFLSQPLLGWGLFVAVLWASHLPAFYDATIRSTPLHAGEHLVYLVTALMLWRPMVASDPAPSRLSHPARLLCLFLLMPQMTFLGLAIYGSNTPIYAPYVATSVLFGTTAVADQHLAGAIMWASGMLFMVPAMAVVLVDWMRTDEREAARSDARLDRAEAVRNG
jgi:putative copper resistance protein D